MSQTRTDRGENAGAEYSKTEFARMVFRWLRQVNQDHELLAIDVKVAVQFGTVNFNRKDGGKAFPSYKNIAVGIGSSEPTVIRSIQRLVQRGHLSVEWGQRGSGHPNQYWMILTDDKPSPVEVSVGDKPPHMEVSRDHVRARKPPPVKRKPPPVSPETSTGEVKTLQNVSRTSLITSELTTEGTSIEERESPPADLFGPVGANGGDSPGHTAPSTTSAPSSKGRNRNDSGGAPHGRRKPSVPIPDDFEPDLGFAERHGVDGMREAERFRNHALSVDRRCVNWPAAWKNWILKAAEIRQRANGNGGPIIDERGNPVDPARAAPRRGRTFMDRAMMEINNAADE